MKPSIYSRPDKPRVMVVKQRDSVTAARPETLPEVVVVSKETDCHVTPPEVAKRMVECFQPCGDRLTLEPHAGTGNLIRALYDAGQSPFELVAVERSFELCNVIRKRFSGREYTNPIHSCFLQYAEAAAGGIEYPQIIMNPPFRQVKRHIEAGLSLLGRGGHDVAILVALVPITFEYDEAEFVCELPVDTFTSTKASTKIVKFERV